MFSIPNRLRGIVTYTYTRSDSRLYLGSTRRFQHNKADLKPTEPTKAQEAIEQTPPLTVSEKYILQQLNGFKLEMRAVEKSVELLEKSTSLRAEKVEESTRSDYNRLEKS